MKSLGIRIRGGAALAALGLATALGAPQDSPSEEDLKAQLPRIPPTEPDEALGTFEIEAGFTIRPVAVEPLVTDPVDACYDADGRLYVVEMRGYPYPEDVPDGRVRRLEDTDGDGRFDEATTFLDGLSWPTSIAPYDGGVIVAVAPEIRFAKDTDGDGAADVVETLFTGFGTKNVQALMNGLLWGPDGWIYGVGGGNGGTIRSVRNPEAPEVELGRRDFRFRPDGSAFEAISGGGQFGHAWDDWGHRFTCNNSNHIRQIALPARYLARNPDYTPPSPIVDIAAEGAAAPVYRISPPEPWRVVRTRQRAADPEFRQRAPATELVATGFFTSATGVTIYRGSAFPERERGNAFIGDVGGNLVHRKIVEPRGSIYQARRAVEGEEFLASTDNWFRPVNFTNTPDGTLLLLDMYRETIEHPWSIPEPIKQHLDLTSGHDRGRLYEVTFGAPAPRRAPRLSAATTAELVARLADPDAWWRETAQRLLIERADPAAVEPLRRLAADRPTPLARAHALWALAALEAIRPADLLPALRDAEPRVREIAARLAEPFANEHKAIRLAMLGLAGDPDTMVRFQAAFSLGEVDGAEAIEALLRIAVADRADRWTRAAVLTSLHGRADRFLTRLLEQPDLANRADLRPWVRDLSVLIGAAGDPKAARRALSRALATDPHPAATQALLVGTAEGLRRAGVDPRQAIDDRIEALLEPRFKAASHAASSGSVPVEDRLPAIRLLGLDPTPETAATLGALLEPSQPADVQLAALRALGDRNEPAAIEAILESWPRLGPTIRREAVEVLMSRTDRQRRLLEAIEAGLVRASELDPARRDQLRSSRDDGIRRRAEAAFADLGRTRTARAEVLAKYQPALEGEADPERGRAVFLEACATCHRAEGEGEEVGPDLATVADRTREDLLIHILDPNREVPPPYLNYAVATKDGRVLTGQIASESPNAITLKRAEGQTDVVPRDQIEELASTGLSLMPEGLEEEVTPQRMADLIAYIRGLRAAAGD